MAKAIHSMLRRAAMALSVCVLLTATAKAEPTGCPATTGTSSPQVVFDQVNTHDVRLGDNLFLHLHGLACAMGTQFDATKLVLRLDGHPFPELLPEVHLRDETVSFQLVRNEKNRAAWLSIVGSPPISGMKMVAVSVGLPGEIDLPTPQTSREPLMVDFHIFGRCWLVFGAAIICLLLLVLFCAGRYSDMLRDPAPVETGARKPYSLGRCQMAVWTVIVLGAFLFVWAVTQDYNGIVTTQSLALLGISGATGLGATVIDSSKQSAAAQNPPAAGLPANPVHDKFLNDILTDANGYALHRLQMLVWTMVLAVVSIWSVWRDLALPDFDESLLVLMGISSLTYLGFKFPE